MEIYLSKLFRCVLCGFYKAAMIDTDPAVCCDMCDTWVHVSCDSKISLAEYQTLVTDPSDDPWICTLCDTTIDQFVTLRVSSQSSLLCICFNARSILSKHFDLAAFLCANYFDVAVVETFLDSTVSDAHIVPSGYNIFCRDCNRHEVVCRGDLENACDMLC